MIFYKRTNSSHLILHNLFITTINEVIEKAGKVKIAFKMNFQNLKQY